MVDQEQLAPAALTRRSALKDGPENTSSLLPLAAEELFLEGQKLFGTERQWPLFGSHALFYHRPKSLPKVGSYRLFRGDVDDKLPLRCR